MTNMSIYRAIKVMTTGACLMMILLASFVSHADDDWERVPSSGAEGGSETAAPLNGSSDVPAVADFLVEMRAIKGDNRHPCEIVGTYAHMAATLREQGVSEQSQQHEIDADFERSASEHHVPKPWIRPIQGVFHHEVAYAYEHPAMSVDQVKSHWVRLCESQRGSQ